MYIITVFYTGREEVPGNCALGQLTSRGFKQQLENGENYRNVYIDSGFLSKNFSSVHHRVRSTGECEMCTFEFKVSTQHNTHSHFANVLPRYL